MVNMKSAFERSDHYERIQRDAPGAGVGGRDPERRRPRSILPEGDYDFVVKKFERARHGGSEKIPACNKAVLTLAVSSAGANGEVPVSLFLYSKFEWKLCQFFTAIGQRRHGEAIRMNWGAVPGAAGAAAWGCAGGRTGTARNGRATRSRSSTLRSSPAPLGQGSRPG